MKAMVEALSQSGGLNRILEALEAGSLPAVLSGAQPVHGAHAAAALHHATGRPIVVLCSDEGAAQRFAADIRAFTGAEPAVLTAREFMFYSAEGVSRQAEHRRIQTLWELHRGNRDFVVATIDGLLQRTMPEKLLTANGMELKVGKEYDLAALTALLTGAGYTRGDRVEGVGQFALRGGILDFFSPAGEEPVRCEFFGDELDSMGCFDVDTQRRTEMTKTCLILPAAEAVPTLHPEGGAGFRAALEKELQKIRRRKGENESLLETVEKDLRRFDELGNLPAADRYLELIYPMACAAEYIPEDAIVLMSEPNRIREQEKDGQKRRDEEITALLEKGLLDGGLCKFFCPWDTFLEEIQAFPVIMVDNFMAGSYPLPPRTIDSLMAKQLPFYGGSMETAAEDIAHYKRAGFRTVVLTRERRRGEILRDFLAERGIACSMDFHLSELPEPGGCVITTGQLSSGLEYSDIQLAIITEGQFAQRKARKKARVKSDPRGKLESFADLSPGDLVVHQRYGIGRFVGIFKMTVDKAEKDYIKIAFAGTDSLYIPATQLDVISKYIGGGEDRPVKLSKLGGTDWAKTKSRAKKAVQDLAKGLIALQAERARMPGYAFSPDSPWQREFEESFEYQETEDQLVCVREIKGDMQRPTPMDRLLCGDVGYGKTEVALRAVMKCVLDGKQAAILVPTTVLARQHFVTVSRRFSKYPVKIVCMSRFSTSKELREAVRGAADGSADIIIGTHKLLQKSVTFKNLGLLVVDEEQRFGVTHKEVLKELSRQVDVLTLSATPIPRTLNMALSGIRDMSTIEEPPMDRQPVQTYVMEHDWGVLADAIRKEVNRGGQVYYLHNRVENIDRTAARLKAMLGEITVGVAHGKMDEDSLSAVMEDMADGAIQVLVCTTIIETGIDIPNVNTLIVEDADKLGLAQLHQIRGRVGRSSRRAYAYFTFRQGKVLSEVAQKRLSAIREFAEFNSGFKIAMRDLEIRGAGNILGPEQSGHMMSVGYDMYLQLLEEAVLEEKGEKPKKLTECSADLTVSAGIPEKYVPSGEERIDLYRRIAHIRTEEDAEDVYDELIDRYGDVPGPVSALIRIAVLRGAAALAGVSEIAQKNGAIRLTLTDFDMERVSAVYNRPEYKGRLHLEAGNVPVIVLKLKPGDKPLDMAERLVRVYRETETAPEDGE